MQPWVYVVIALVVIIIIVVIVVIATSSSSTAFPALPPSPLTISWVMISDLSLAHPSHVPKSVYTLTTDTSLSNYGDIIINEFAESTIQYVYNTVTTDSTTGVITPNLTNIFIRYIEGGITRFALVALIISDLYIIKTASDIGTLIDPTKYTGTWSVSNRVDTTLLFT